MTVDEALETLRELADPATIEGKAAYHKIDRPYIGTNNQILNDIGKEWRRALDLDHRIALASGLWDTNIFEGRVMASKLLTQARIRPDQAVWELITSWVGDFDSWAIADHACGGAKRVVAIRSVWIRWRHESHRIICGDAERPLSSPYPTQTNFPKPHNSGARTCFGLGRRAGKRS